MKRKLPLLLGAFTLAAALLPLAALADTFNLTLTSATQAVTTAGGTLTFYGTLTAPASNAATEYVYGDSVSFNMASGTYSTSTTSFDNAVVLGTDAYLPGTSYTGQLFTINLSGALTQGLYTGAFNLYGGSTPSANSLITFTPFTVKVVPAAAVTPEPSSLLLLGTGAIAAFGTFRRRLQS